MLQQTTVATVRGRFAEFIDRFPTIQALANAPLEDVLHAWQGLGYYSRARNLHKAAQLISDEYFGIMPNNEEDLRRLPGIGDYTAAAIMAIAYKRRTLVMDTNIERIIARLFAVDVPLPKARPLLKQHLDAIMNNDAGITAQALMDLGSSLCQQRRTNCPKCPLNMVCAAHLQGTPLAFPVRAVKPPRPTRYGWIYWLEAEGKVLLEHRPPKGLLGGMAGFPTSSWLETLPIMLPPMDADWQEAGAVRHIFTHFALELQVMKASISNAPHGWWVPVDALHTTALPTLMKKVVRLFE
jgi:A/G-specific adenine glycosylase